jgi:hypothetical protein
VSKPLPLEGCSLSKAEAVAGDPVHEHALWEPSCKRHHGHRKRAHAELHVSRRWVTLHAVHRAQLDGGEEGKSRDKRGHIRRIYRRQVSEPGRAATCKAWQTGRHALDGEEEADEQRALRKQGCKGLHWMAVVPRGLGVSNCPINLHHRDLLGPDGGDVSLVGLRCRWVIKLSAHSLL